MSETLYKWLGEDGRSCHGGSGIWKLPKNGRPGAWRSVHGPLVPCRNGIHLCREQDLLYWCAARLFIPEVMGHRLDESYKVVVRRARLVREVTTWNARVARLFACDCAERALTAAAVTDARSHRAVEVARMFAEGKATEKRLVTARAAAQAAAQDLEWTSNWSMAASVRATAAAWAAEVATWTAEAATWATIIVNAGDMARTAANVAIDAFDLTWNAEKRWQTERFMWYLNGEQT